MSDHQQLPLFLESMKTQGELTEEQCEALLKRAEVSSENPNMPVLPPPLMDEFMWWKMEQYNLKVVRKRSVKVLHDP